jgi:ectoine hydroxylase-related dioxygenase (phytanoyl-CoA dioxygenase family)
MLAKGCLSLLTSLFRATLEPQQIEQFQRDGHLLIRSAYSRESLIELAEQLETARSAEVLLRDPEARKEPNAFFWRRSPDIARFVLDRGLGEVASTLLGVDGVRLIHESLFEKRKEAGRVPWHRDSHFWSFSGVGALTVWIPLHDTPLSMSPLRYASGSHCERDTHILSRFEKVLIPLRYPIAVSSMKLGDIVIHHSQTLHGAARASERGTRKALSLHLFDANATVLPSDVKDHVNHAKRCGWDRLVVEEPFPDELAPLIFRREPSLTAAGRSF